MKTTLTILAAVATLSMSGCVTMGALCYIPAKTTGQCSATTVQEAPGAEPVAGVKL